jgi:hypothetical protein
LKQPAEDFDFDFDTTDVSSAPEAAAARRAEPRLQGHFPAQVRGVDSSGATFLTQTVVDNFGATEFDLSLARRVEEGRRLLVVINIHEATVALHGNVRRAEPQADGSHRMTVAVTHHRFL